MLEEVELIHRKCNVDLEFLDHRRLLAALVLYHQVVGIQAAVLLRLQIEGTAEGALLPIGVGLVSDDTLGVRDDLAAGIPEGKSADTLVLLTFDGNDFFAPGQGVIDMDKAKIVDGKFGKALSVGW